ncbi:hypothetical protein AGMMS49573_10940 [Endomicrobiia bacterium]|nr:hypothetical protein AGMMS49532_08300 [Endomicrobiia bacterium]GHT18197.1 hypothetical protein AGMMS49573_10940 [Endomicrobiia bacterium]
MQTILITRLEDGSYLASAESSPNSKAIPSFDFQEDMSRIPDEPTFELKRNKNQSKSLSPANEKEDAKE